MSRNKKILMAAVVLALLAALAGTVIVLAQDAGSSEDDQPESGPFPLNPARFQPRFYRFQHALGEVEYDTLLADALDITVEELQDARQQAWNNALQQAVDEGRITEEQAVVVSAVRTIRQIVVPGELLADALGISVEELREARQDGSLRELLVDLDMSLSDVKEAILVVFEDTVQRAVEDGLLTEEQADLLLDRPGLVLAGPGDIGPQPRCPGPQSRRCDCPRRPTSFCVPRRPFAPDGGF